jgi:hypothetical protein
MNIAIIVLKLGLAKASTSSGLICVCSKYTQQKLGCADPSSQGSGSLDLDPFSTEFPHSLLY